MSNLNFSENISGSFDQMIKKDNKSELFSLLVTPSYNDQSTNLVNSNIDMGDQEQQKLTKWLAGLKLLYGVPLNYLVADEELLPIDSIKFFCVDQNWLNSLLDGAYSIGSNVEAYQLLDEVIARGPQATTNQLTGLYGNVNQAAVNLRQRLFKENNDLVNNNLASPIDSDKQQTISGFLLRSQVVSNWPGLEVDGYVLNESVDKITAKTPFEYFNKLKIVRMDRLSPDILLCMFDGEIDKVEFHTPAEELHFGFDNILDSNNNFTKTPKDESSGVELIEQKISINQELFRNNNVINIAQLAKKFPNVGTRADKFALQMTTGIDTACFTKKIKV